MKQVLPKDGKESKLLFEPNTELLLGPLSLGQAVLH